MDQHGSNSGGGMNAGSGMDMGNMDMMGGCKISMVWNWYTVGACFISDTWQVTSEGMFAGSCIGVVCLVVALEFLRRTSREYDRYLIRKQQAHVNQHGAMTSTDAASSSSGEGHYTDKGVEHGVATVVSASPVSRRMQAVRPTMLEQLVRAVLHMFLFGLAYFIMLLAMYFNGYIIISILIGAFIGGFLFTWETLGSVEDRELTYCCG